MHNESLSVALQASRSRGVRSTPVRSPATGVQKKVLSELVRLRAEVNKSAITVKGARAAGGARSARARPRQLARRVPAPAPPLRSRPGQS